jgi:hypothetical protein
MSLRLLPVALLLVACGPHGVGFDDGGVGPGDAGTDGIVFKSDAGYGGDGAPTGPTFGSECSSGATVTGTVLAPNGMDPLPNIYVYIAKQVNPFPAGNYCNQCNMPLDAWYTHEQSAVDGTFSLDLSSVPYAPTVQFVVNVGHFRKVTSIPVACGANTAPTAAATLPGKSSDGDIPNIAVATGNSDHLDQILTALGITEYDCYEGRASTGSSSTCTTIDTVANLLNKTSKKTVDDYHLVFLSCAPNAYKTWGSPTMASNIAAFANAGGRVFATDMSYDYVAQAFPSDITWMGPSGTPQPVQGANVGVAGTYTGNIDDKELLAWLQKLGVTTTNTVPLQGFLNPWSVQSSIPMSTTLVVDGTVSYTGGSTDVPLTTEFDVSTCGRVIYSSYHTVPNTTTSLLPQERILEYLMMQVGTCVGPPPPN